MLNKNILSDYMAASKLVLPESIAVVPFLFNRVHGAIFTHKVLTVSAQSWHSKNSRDETLMQL